MLGLPSSPGPVGGALLVAGLLVAAVGVVLLLRGRRAGLRESALVVCAAVTLGAGPFLVWRIVEDVRYTTGLDVYERRAAGPIQAFLPGYLLDGARGIIPRDATYAVAVGNDVPYPTARKAFPALALTSLFPRISVADPSRADWIVAWGVDPRVVTRVTRVEVARRRSGSYPAVYVARVAR